VAETHWERKLNSPWRAHLLARRVEPEKNIKGLSFTSGGIIRADHIRPYYKRPERNKGKTGETLKSKEHED